MGTSRTGTGRWKALRAQVIREGRGTIHTCPLCNTTLDYHHSRKPNSAEVDHIIPHAHGGTDTRDNVRIICRHCNQSRGARAQPKISPTRPATPIKTSRAW